MNRRSFVKRLALGAAGAACLTEPGAAYAKKKLSKIGVQLYTVRRELEADFEGTLAKVASLGYREVEFAGYYGRTPAEVKAILARNGLAAPSAHFQSVVSSGGVREAVEAAGVVGHSYLVYAWLPPEERKSLDDYKRLAERLNRAGEECRRAGIQFGYHNHDFEFAPMEGRIPYDLILEGTDARLVKMELDLYWITKGGQSPLAYFRKHPGRFPLVHVKDMDGTPKRYFTEVGRGTIDFGEIFAASKQAGIKHYFVEQDETPASPFESIRTSIDYLKRLEF
ncbi:MAG TPA: sugar phosphate isomerase/epimerase [Pyrinomonadaceae bacterium]|nr:sugar phosphate isomerase/epimerase [Pyrinomonadaceae bacterium]